MLRLTPPTSPGAVVSGAAATMVQPMLAGGPMLPAVSTARTEKT
jgi:hypothetical protein